MNIEDQIIALRNKRAKACEVEDYMLAAKINDEILKLKEKLK
jgi:protein-arginine kinase activator protein McsA